TADKAATSQVAIALRTSPAIAADWIWIAGLLTGWDRLRQAFLDGHWSFTRTRYLLTELAHLTDPDVRTYAETCALALADRPTADRTLRNQIAEMVIALDPDAAADRREEFADTEQNVTITDDTHGHMRLHATMPADVGVFLATSIRNLINERICPRDPRPTGRLRVEALKELHHMPDAVLACTCDDEHCTRAIPLPPTPAPDPELDLDYTPPPTPAPAPARVDDDVEIEAETDEGAGPRPPIALMPAQSSLTVITDPTGVAAPRLVGYGAIDPQHWHDIADGHLVTRMDLPELELPELDDPGIDLAAIGRNLAAWQTVTTITERGLAPPVDPTGHGGYVNPPRWALWYKPRDWLRQKIICWDKTCRYPGCGRDAADCELDHLVKFNRADPRAGGWTVEYNLIPLCRADHQRKHLGLWIPTMLADRAVTWRNPVSGKTVTTFPG
ncbi:HNH endonuclease, partial [Gordonia desulfuricans]